jgi:hypothetical protein
MISGVRMRVTLTISHGAITNSMKVVTAGVAKQETLTAFLVRRDMKREQKISTV